MIYNLNEITEDPFQQIPYDVCIIGAGPAGITLALNLSKEFNVLLLEAGGFDHSVESQEVYKGKNIGHEYYNLDECRARWLGGGTNLWGGWCYPLDELDFKKREFVKYSGWPIEKKDLDPYRERAKAMFKIPASFNFDSPQRKIEDPVIGWDDVMGGKSRDFHQIDFWRNPEMNFGYQYKDELKKSTNVHCYLNANLTDMALLDDLSAIKKTKVQNYKGKVFDIQANTFVLATGAIENARLLLNFNKQLNKGIGNKNDLVGRFFADHPHFRIGKILLEDKLREKVLAAGRALSSGDIAPSEEFQLHNRTLNFGFRIKINPKGMISMTTKERIRNMLCSQEWMINSINYYRENFSHKRRFNCFHQELNLDNTDGIISTGAEAAPNPLSRVTIGDGNDRFDMQRTILDWQLTKVDKDSIRTGLIGYGKYFATKDLGRVQIDKWVLKEDDEFPGSPQPMGGLHHMGTTRMSMSPREGVVDADQKVYGMNNFYIAGSSVFPTTGHVNPTFTIVQMTLRLADHINSMQLFNKRH